MKVAGFSFIKNAIQYDYPIREALQSIAPLCDELYLAVGKSQDETLQMIRGLDIPKLNIIETDWDPALREGGAVLADETNKAFDAIPEDVDWCVYIQGDEVLHEKGHEELIRAMEKYKDRPEIEGLLLNYRHFYGSYDYIGDSRKWYRKEVRIIRNDKSIRSFKDAQGFRKDGRKLHVKPTNAWMHHYGWVKHPEKQQQKMQTFNRLWHDEDWMDKHIPKVEVFDYSQIDSLNKFEGSHPQVMRERIEKMNWQFSFDPTNKKFSLKERLSRWIEKMTGWRPGEYKNYKVV